MYPRILTKLRNCIREGRYVVSLHADEEMDFDGLSIYDVESAILGGEIVGRRTDEDTGEYKYIIKGSTLDQRSVIIVAKIGQTNTAVIITVFRDE